MTYLIHEHPPVIEDVLIHFGYDIRYVRFSGWLSQTKLSERAGLSQATFSMIENGLAEGVRLDKIAQIAAAMGGDLLIRPCPHPPGISDLTNIGRVRRDLDGTLYAPGRPFPNVRRVSGRSRERIG